MFLVISLLVDSLEVEVGVRPRGDSLPSREVEKAMVALPSLQVRERVASPCTPKQLMNSATALWTRILLFSIFWRQGDISVVRALLWWFQRSTTAAIFCLK